LEVNNVNDIDKVYRILTQHMNIPNISIQARECLKYTYEGNAHLEKNELSQAIASYNAALATKYEPQEGILLLLRATAYLKRAFAHQVELRKTVNDLSDTVPDPAQLGRLYQVAAQHPSLSKPLFHKVLNDCKVQDKKFRQTKYRHGLYEYALLHAAQDALRSTQLLPHHAKTWLRAGDALAELRKLKESVLYYQKAIELDPTLRERLEPVIERLERSQMFLEKAKGWYSSDVLRLALDVAG
jgi:tetratricopeptide (TPR) repeat protein